MTDAYRTSAFPCPTCTSSVLREFHDRLVCDECNGMLIADDDFVASVHEIDGTDAPLAITEAEPTTTACPRCTRAMTSCVLAIGKLRLDGRVLRCALDGVWISRTAMTGAFARASRSHPHATGRGGAPTAMAGFGGPQGTDGALNAVRSGFGSGPASAQLAIGQWQDKRPRVHTLFVSAHKDRELGCPSCKEARLRYEGDRWACGTCAGAFVEDAALAAMVAEMTNTPWELPAVTGGKGDRPCPICKEAMTVEVLEAVTIDRCSPHGVWFDDSELQAALHHASTPPSGVGGWLKQLFHRHGAIVE